jgi:hypothetical protein
MNGLTYFQIVTAITALLAVIVAFRVQRQLLRLQRAQEELAWLQIAERNVQVATTLDDESIILRPFAPDQGINSVAVYFPERLGISPIAIVGPDLRIHFTRITISLTNFWDSCTPVVPDHAIVRLTAAVPVALEIHGHSKGVTVFTRAFYDLYSKYVRPPESESTIVITGLSLNNYLLAGEDTSEALEAAFQRLLPVLTKPSQRKDLTPRDVAG